jgi:hypothetical protein
VGTTTAAISVVAVPPPVTVAAPAEMIVPFAARPLTFGPPLLLLWRSLNGVFDSLTFFFLILFGVFKAKINVPERALHLIPVLLGRSLGGFRSVIVGRSSLEPVVLFPLPPEVTLFAGGRPFRKRFFFLALFEVRNHHHKRYLQYDNDGDERCQY